MFLLVKLHIDMGLEAVLPGPQNALYVMLCYESLQYVFSEFQNSCLLLIFSSASTTVC